MITPEEMETVMNEPTSMDFRTWFIAAKNGSIE